MGKKSGKTCRLCLGMLFPTCLLLGLAAIGLGITMYLEYPSVVANQVAKKVTVQKGHATYEQLKIPSVPIYKSFYFFNLTNHKEFADSRGGVKPVLEEVGPYSFIEYRNKEFINEDSADNSMINYTQSKTFFFHKETSNPNVSESDTICTISIPMVGAFQQAKDSFLERTALRGLITATGAKIYTCQEATALAWKYSDSFIRGLHGLGKYPLSYVSIQVNDSVYDHNVSSIYTGVEDISKIGQFFRWNGLKYMSTWHGGAPWPNGTGANCINGTEGLFFRPNLKEGDGLTVFVDDIQRSIDMVYKEKVKPLGLSAFRYRIDESTFKSAFNEPKNARWGSWCPDGMIYLGPTQALEVPVYGSKPHFLDGDPGLLESVVGLTPDREKHDTVLDVEPITGANLNFKRQLQVVVQVNQTEKRPFYEFPLWETENIIGFNGTNSLYVPILYIDEHAEMDEAFKNYLEGKGLKQVQILEVAVPTLFGVLLLVGVVSLLISLLACAGFVKKTNKRIKEERQPLLDPSTA